jgi:hypothetical protein
VVAPASLLENWERELALWCPRLRVVTYHGAHKEMVRNQLEKWRYDVSVFGHLFMSVQQPPGPSGLQEPAGALHTLAGVVA